MDRYDALARLERTLVDLAEFNRKLLLLIGASNSGKTQLLNELGYKVGAVPLRVGVQLGHRLAMIPRRQRHLEVNSVLSELGDGHARGNLLLVDNIELLFDRTLRLDPLGTLMRHAHARRVVAVWPGELRDGRLTYAEKGHPEHQDYGTEGLIPFHIQ